MSELRRPLLLLLIPMLGIAPAAAFDWIEQASRPGTDLPARGQSRFDELFRLDHGSYRIPYPFDRLVAELGAKIDNGDNPGVRRVFVPMGRSLQRDTPAPDHFRMPREIIALEGEPVNPGGHAGAVLEYRLFIAHQPASASLEVISYNDAAGRFEFQVVDGYTSGREPSVRSAPRIMCMSCHHNAGPIFPRRPWRETSFDVDVARHLVAALPRRFDSLVDVLGTDAGIVDMLAERANYLAAAQTVWRDGCVSLECRAAMLRAALQYRLSGESSFDWNSPAYRRQYHDELARNWSRRWPDGLALAGSRLSDRDPFAEDAVAAGHDPLQPRPPQAVWREVDATLSRGIIFRLAGFFTAADIERLDNALLAAARERRGPAQTYTADCRARQASDDLYVLSCGETNRVDRLQASFEFGFSAGRVDALEIRSLRIPGDVNLLQPLAGAQAQHDRRLHIEPRHRSGLASRLANGDRLESLTLTWGDHADAIPSGLEVRVAADSELLEETLAQLIEKQARGGSSLTQGIFERRRLLEELAPLLSMPALAWPEPAAVPVAVAANPPPADLGGSLNLLQPYCAPCHGNDSRHPPGFLAGSDAAARVARCAPRLLSRLRAWQKVDESTLSPMPPPASIEFTGTSAAQWPRSDHYRSLVDGLETLLRSSVADDWRGVDYADLPSCLGPSGG